MKSRTKNEREVEILRHSLNDFKSPKRFRKTDWAWIQKKHTIGQTEYFAIYEVVGNWQVIRMFLYRSWSKKHEALHEPLQYWLKADGSHVIVCKNRQCLGNYYIDPWVWDSELCIRANCGSRDVRNLNCQHVKIRSLIPELKRISTFRADNFMVNNLMPFWFVHSLLTNNRIETLFKLKQNWLTWKFYHYEDRNLTEGLWQSIRVALRHGYHWDSKEEINDWVDMIDDLQYLGLDTRNPHYICPANLQEAHHNWDTKARIKRFYEDNNEKVIAYEPTFKKNRERFFGMLFTDGNIKIEVIPTAKDIVIEGAAMHHCVGNYYNRENSLILSAKINGRRIETIEVNLKYYNVVQSRGLQNSRTEYHDEIVKLVEDNMNEIMKRNKKQRKAA